MTTTIPQVTVVSLPAGADKASWLCNEIAELRAQGVAAADIAVFAPTPDAAQVLQSRLAASQLGEGVSVQVPLAAAMKVLATPEAIQATGRNSRLLTRYEESFFMEDLKVCGMEPKRIGSMLDFFRKGWADRAYLDSAWLMFKEEQELHALIKQTLTNLKGYLPVEAASVACDMLESAPAAAESLSAAYVFAVDYNSMSRAAQHLIRLLSAQSLTVAADNHAATSGFEPYINASGTEELAQVGPVNTVAADAGTPAMGPFGALQNLQALKAANEENTEFAPTIPASDGLTELICTSPQEECEAVVAKVQAWLAEGMQPSEIACTVPNKIWERNFSNALQDAGITVRRGGDVGPVGGDIRYAERSLPAQTLALITLVAHPEDEAALRAWCGFGTYTTCRSLFSEVYAVCAEAKQPLWATLEDIRAAVVAGNTATLPYTFKSDAEMVGLRLEALRGLRAKLAPLAGQTLVKAAWEAIREPGSTAGVPQSIQALCRELAESDDAVTVNAKLHDLMAFPRLAAENAVALVAPEAILDLGAKAVMLTGMVNGFFPAHRYFDRTKVSPEKARRMLAKDAQRFFAALGAKEVCISWFDRMFAADAETLQVRAERFYFEDGARMARTSRSLVADAMFGVAVQPEQ